MDPDLPIFLLLNDSFLCKTVSLSEDHQLQALANLARPSGSPGSPFCSGKTSAGGRRERSRTKSSIPGLRTRVGSCVTRSGYSSSRRANSPFLFLGAAAGKMLVAVWSSWKREGHCSFVLNERLCTLPLFCSPGEKEEGGRSFPILGWRYLSPGRRTCATYVSALTLMRTFLLCSVSPEMHSHIFFLFERALLAAKLEIKGERKLGAQTRGAGITTHAGETWCVHTDRLLFLSLLPASIFSRSRSIVRKRETMEY